MIKDNNVKAYWGLFEREFPKCYSFAYNLTKSEAVAESIACSVLQRILLERIEINSQGSVENALLGMLRQELAIYFASAVTANKSKRVVPLNKRGGSGKVVSDKAVENMPARRREIFLLSRRSGLSSAEIAQQMGISARTVEKHIELAVKQLEQNASAEEASKGEFDVVVALRKHMASSGKSAKYLTGEWLANNITSSELDFELAREYASLSPRPCEEPMARTRESIGKMIPAEKPAVMAPNVKPASKVMPATKVAPATKDEPLRRLSWKSGVAWVASVAAMVALAVMITLGQRPEPIEWTLVRTAIAEQKEVVMPDGSTIWLNGASEVLYPSRFEGEDRKVYASGELYADIVKNPEVPFVVDAKDVCAKVYGTKFNMKAHADSRNVEIALVEGAVTMQVEEGTRKYELQPGDIVRYDKVAGEFENYRFEPLNYATWKDNGNLYFVNMNLGDIVKELERRFDCTIILENRSLEELRYYASFVNNEGVDEILKALNARNSMKIKRTDDHILISKR